jgi:hypothetical protein
VPGIAISYRRDDTGWITGRIFDRLKAHYEWSERNGEGNQPTVFMDYDSTPVGLDFRDYIRGVLDRSDILLAIIGPRWSGDDGKGNSRLGSEADWVRIEIEAALKRSIPVIPVLIDRTPMPSAADLPEGMRDLVFRQAAIIDTQIDFNAHIERLIREIDRLLGVESVRRDGDIHIDPTASFRDAKRTGEGLSSRAFAADSAKSTRQPVVRFFSPWIATPRAGYALGTLACVVAVAVALYMLSPKRVPIEPIYSVYNSSDLGVTVAYPRNLFSLDTTERKERKLSLRDGDGQILVRVLRTDLPDHKDVKLGREKEIDELRKLNYTLTYIAPEKERNWSNWYVLSGVKHGTEFYFRRWYSDDSVVSIEFVYPKEQAMLFEKLIPTMTHELTFSNTVPK